MKPIDVLDLYLEYVSNGLFNEYADLMACQLYKIKDDYEEPVYQSIIVDFFKIYNKKQFMNMKSSRDNINSFKYNLTLEDVNNLFDCYKILLGVGDE